MCGRLPGSHGATRSRSSSPCASCSWPSRTGWATRLARRVLPAIWVVLVAGTLSRRDRPRALRAGVQSVLGLSTSGQRRRDARARGAVVADRDRRGDRVLAVEWRTCSRACVGRVAAAMEHRRPRLALGALAGISSCCSPASSSRRRPIAVAFADPVTPAYVRQARFALAMVGAGVRPRASVRARRSTPAFGPRRRRRAAHLRRVVRRGDLRDAGDLRRARREPRRISRPRFARPDVRSSRPTWSLRRSAVARGWRI